MKKFIVEFIGTFFLVFTVGMTVIAPGGAGPMAPLAEFARQNMDQWSKIQASMMSAFAGTKPEPPAPEKEQPPKNK